MISEPLDLITERLTAWAEVAIAKLPNLAVAVLVFMVMLIVSRWVREAARKGLDRTLSNLAVARLLGNLLGFAVAVLGLFVALGILGLDKTVTSLLAGAGVLGLALGFAFQDIAANFIAGTLISFRRPYTIGDLVESQGHTGTVDEINLRTTILVTPQGQRVLLPNKDVFQNPLVNYSTGRRRVDLVCGVSYGDDLEGAREAALEAVSMVAGRDELREPELFYTGFGGSSIDFVVRFWIPFERQSQFLAAQSAAIVALKAAFDEAGVTIPFPIRTLDFGVEGGQPLAEAVAPLLPFRGAGGADGEPR